MSDDERQEDPRHASPRLSQGRGDNEARARVQSERSKAVTESNMDDLAKKVRRSFGGAASASSDDDGESSQKFGDDPCAREDDPYKSGTDESSMSDDDEPSAMAPLDETLKVEEAAVERTGPQAPGPVFARRGPKGPGRARRGLFGC